MIPTEVSHLMMLAEAFREFQYPSTPLHRLDVLRLFTSLYRRVGKEYGLLDEEAELELETEFDDELAVV
ncbi:hypothetical protein ADL00_23320 [Streptomyces sp. AS58]|uniref:hypothetical protein n=1 Tax=Streptomyces sp. AS58 TaxID=1519489 RepID=UPI0006AFBB4E|nr:hypothetical protein [Streptomyces sp. AS58]KOV62909.1 hypothetical protein ADL00_23320 [Streptomyces sp. AS58]